MTYLTEENENNLINDLKEYGKDNHIEFLHIEDSKWKICTTEELKRIEKGRERIMQRRKRETSIIQNNISLEENDATITDEKSLHDKETRSKRNIDTFTDISNTYQQTYYFDSFKVSNGNITKLFKFPNTTATWVIQSFSIHEKYGIAFGDPTEIVISN